MELNRGFHIMSIWDPLQGVKEPEFSIFYWYPRWTFMIFCFVSTSIKYTRSIHCHIRLLVRKKKNFFLRRCVSWQISSQSFADFSLFLPNRIFAVFSSFQPFFSFYFYMWPFLLFCFHLDIVKNSKIYIATLGFLYERGRRPFFTWLICSQAFADLSIFFPFFVNSSFFADFWRVFANSSGVSKIFSLPTFQLIAAQQQELIRLHQMRQQQRRIEEQRIQRSLQAAASAGTSAKPHTVVIPDDWP